MKDKQFLQKAWDAYVSHNRLEDSLFAGLSPVIQAYWQRSQAYHVDPFQATGPLRYQRDELTRLQLENQDLIDISIPLMMRIYNLVRGSEFIVTLCDKHGVLLKVIGDEGPLKKARQIQFVEGADWSEQAVGTNAIGTCLYTQKPLQIFAAEHYSKICQWWTCSASPIRNPNGEIVGVLNMSGPFEAVHTHTLGMIVSAVAAIENQWIVEEKNHSNVVMQRYLESAIDTLPEGVLVLNQEHEVIHVNQEFVQVTGLSETQIVGQRVSHVLEAQELEWLLQTDLEIVDREVTFSISEIDRPWRVLFSIKPIYDTTGNRMGALLTFRDMVKVRRFVNRMTSRHSKVTFADILGESRAFLECLRDARMSARCDSTVLLTGESGTGKDLFAQAIHADSARQHQPFIAINCGAIPRELLGSELFGYAEGAFTGAKKGGNAGKFELADGGTLFLDEVGEMSLEMQIHLLRVLQNQEIVRIGGDKVIPVDVRIVAATNEDLLKAVERGQFRQDLYYRLNVIPIHVPNLRQRKEDIPQMAEVFVKRLSSRLNLPHNQTIHFSDEFLATLMNWEWPGNVRELQNVLERSMLKATGDTLLAEHLPAEMRESIPVVPSQQPIDLKEEVKRRALLGAIEACQGNYKAAARRLGISRSTLYRQLERYGLK